MGVRDATGWINMSANKNHIWRNDPISCAKFFTLSFGMGTSVVRALWPTLHGCCRIWLRNQTESQGVGASTFWKQRLVHFCLLPSHIKTSYFSRAVKNLYNSRFTWLLTCWRWDDRPLWHLPTAHHHRQEIFPVCTWCLQYYKLGPWALEAQILLC